MQRHISKTEPLRQQRPLTSLNLPFYYLTLVKRNGNSCDLIEIDGRLDHELLEAAIRSALRRHPLLACRVRRRGLGYMWEQAPADGPIDLRIEQGDRSPDDPYLTRNVWKEALRIESGNPIRFHLLETPDKSYFQVVSAHAYADARSCFRLAHDIAAHYTILSDGGTPPSEPIEARIQRNLLWNERSLLVRGMWTLRAAGEIGRDLFTRARALRLRPRQEGNTAVEIEELGTDGLGRAKATAARWGVTVHSLFLLALARVCSKFNGSAGSVTLIDMFSLRPFANEDVSNVYDCMVVPYKIRIDTRKDNQTLLRQISGTLAALKSGGILRELYRQHLYALSSIALPKRLSTRLVCDMVAKANLISTNPGNLPYDLTRFGAAHVTDYWSFSQLFPPGKVMVLFSTFRGSLRLIAVYDQSAFPEGVAQVLKPLATYLRSGDSLAFT